MTQRTENCPLCHYDGKWSGLTLDEQREAIAGLAESELMRKRYYEKMSAIQISVGTVDGSFNHAVVVPPRCELELLRKERARLQGIVSEIDRLLKCVPGINDERDSVPLLHAVKRVIEQTEPQPAKGRSHHAGWTYPEDRS